MNFWIDNYLICFIISVLLAGLIIPKILLIAFRKSLFDEVNERKIHRGVVPRLGGIAFLPALIFSFCLVVGLNWRMGSIQIQREITPDIVQIFFLMCGLMLIYLVGMADDLIGIRYRAKFIFQIIAGMLIVTSGLWITNLDGFFGIYQWPMWIGILFTILFIIYVTNAINLIDGIDGLASGLSIIALLFYSFVLYQSMNYIYFLIAGAILGTLVPFFYFNVFGSADRHTKIFMGDTGALTVGLMLSFLAITVFNIPPQSLPGKQSHFILALAPILLPCLDVTRVFMHRIRRGRNPFLPDKCHIHHKLLALGFRQRQTMALILASDAIFIGLNLWLSSKISPTWLMIGDILAWTGLNMLITYLIRRREKATGQILYQ